MVVSLELSRSGAAVYRSGSMEPPFPPDEPRIVHLGARLVVVDKPAGMLAVPGRAPQYRDCVASRIQARFPVEAGPLVVHRLDMETSGLMVLALDRGAQRVLSRQFERRAVRKVYVAVLDGEVDGDAGTVELAHRLDPDHRPRQVLDPQQGKLATTHWRVLERGDGATRLELHPETGRTHQLRVHAAAPRSLGGLGCPIRGDTLYGDPATAPRMLLHATELELADPDTGERHRFTSPVPF